MFTFKPSMGELKHGEYSASRGEKRDIITVCCPNCRGEYQLPKQYQVGAGGILNPVLRCPLFDCGWKSQAMLRGWK